MKFSVKQLATLAHVSVRTLHFYDEIGLLKPSFIKENGYRSYGEKEMLKLQQILFFRELDFPLEEIRLIMASPVFKTRQALTDQRTLLSLKRQRIEKMMATIDQTINQLKGGEKMKSDDIFAGLNDQKIEEYKLEAKKRWGNTDAYRQSTERTKGWTNDDYKKAFKEGKEFTKKLANALEKGATSPEAQKMIAEHYKSINRFYDCSLSMYRNLGEMYVNDPRFTAYYDEVKPGLAKQVKDAIDYFAGKQKKT